MIVIGTAGHIDHGKSAIVKRLTGTDPDRLPEEKARGMTIDLGFAFMDGSENEKIAFVDVPGHERFVRNMIAGAGGIDAVLMVIAADDGWMPQSQEHFQIIRLLGVKSGLIVVNKSDLVDSEWLELLENEIRDKVAGSFLQDAPIINVSATTGAGFDRLQDSINSLASSVANRDDADMPRLYADRAFVRQGIGQVVTGTVRGGSLSVGQPALVWPARVQGKIRTLQSEGRDVNSVTPGSRTAVSMTGVDRQYMTRGSVILSRTDVDYFTDRPVLALMAELLSEAPITLEDRRRVLMIVGSSETEGEIRLYDQKEIRPGQSAMIFFKPDNPLFTLVGDHFVFRLVTPMVTLGGGTILDQLEHLPRRKELSRYDYLKGRLDLEPEALVITELEKLIVTPKDGFLHQIEIARKGINQAITKLTKEGIIGLEKQQLYHIASYEKNSESVIESISSWLTDNPHEKGLPFNRLKRMSDLGSETLTALLQLMVRHGSLTYEGELYNLVGRGVTLKGVIKQAYLEILELLKAEPYSPPTLSNIAAKGKHHKQAIKFMIDTGEGYKCGSEFLFLSESWSDIIRYVKESLNQNGQITPAELREKFGFSRKWVIPILEETDRIGLTERAGDQRIKGAKFG